MNTRDQMVELAAVHGFVTYPTAIFCTDQGVGTRQSVGLVRDADVHGLKQSLLLTEFEQQWHVTLSISVDLACFWSIMAEEMSSESVGYQDGLWAFLQENHVCEERDGDDGLGDSVFLQSVEPLTDALLRPIGLGKKRLYDLQAASACVMDFEHLFLPWFEARQSLEAVLRLIKEGDATMMTALHAAHAERQRWFFKRKPPQYLEYESMMFALDAPVAEFLQGVLLCCNGDVEAGTAVLLRYQQALQAKRRIFGG
ncbi:MAG TPA: hypothetical protein PK856_08265 [Vitreoscilla sp.]|nr:hypothetical protein [Vitreoscilla sp.]